MGANKHKVLEDVSGDRCFWIYNGPVVRNIYELADALEHISQSTFEYHITAEKNDFGNWVGNVLGDNELAEKIRYKGRQETINAIKKRILELEDDIEREKVENVLGVSEENGKATAQEMPESKTEEPVKLIEMKQETTGKFHPEEKENKINGLFKNEISGIKESLRSHLELFLLGLVVGILIGKFVLGIM